MREQIEKTAARIRITEDGSLSHQKAELYCLIRADEVISPTAAFTIAFYKSGKATASGTYKPRIDKTAAVRERMETLMAEKDALREQGDWGDLMWQTKQVYRKAAARDDTAMMMRASEQLFKILVRNERLQPKEADNDEAPEGESKGRGAPTAPTPLENSTISHMRDKLVGR